jgi:hypothetical protein
MFLVFASKLPNIFYGIHAYTSVSEFYNLNKEITTFFDIHKTNRALCDTLDFPSLEIFAFLSTYNFFRGRNIRLSAYMKIERRGPSKRISLKETKRRLLRSCQIYDWLIGIKNRWRNKVIQERLKAMLIVKLKSCEVDESR